MVSLRVTYATDRRRYIDLQPVKIHPDSPFTPGPKKTRSYSGSSTISSPPLPSPTILAARAYYLDNAAPIGHHVDALQRRRSLIEGQLFPRRHSLLVTPKSLAVQLETS